MLNNIRLRRYLNSIKPAVGINNQSERERWLETVLYSIPNNYRILDAGAGPLRFRNLCEHLNYVSQDFVEFDGLVTPWDHGAKTSELLEYGKTDIVSDITSIPEPDESFDAIMCIEVLEHLPDPTQAIREFARLLKPGGFLIITAPFYSTTHLAPYHYCTGFNKYWYEKHLPENHFEITEISVNGNFYELIAQEIYKIPSMANLYSKSRLSFFELLSIFIVQRMLLRFSNSDNGSSELLCFGYHVLARKSRPHREKVI